jgi:hypothetical protein
MMSCENCVNLAAEMRDVRAIVEHLVTEMTATRTVVEGMQKTLLGNGQPGRCAEHGVRIARLERWRSWVAGALAILGILWMAAVTIVGAAVVERLKQ